MSKPMQGRQDPAPESGQDHEARAEQSDAGAEGEGSKSREKEQGSKDQKKQESSSKPEEQGEDKQGKEERGGKEGQGEKTGPTTTQWVVGVGSTLLVLALLGFVIYEAFSGTESPPAVVVRVERVLPIAGGYVVEVGAYNEGGTTAAALTIEGTLKRDTTTVETSTATIQYVPAETEREAGLFFTKDPRQYRLEVRPTGYDRP